MTSLYGYYEIFDYSAFTDPSVVYPRCLQTAAYTEGTIMRHISDHCPKLTYLCRLAALDGILASPQNRVTFFTPPETSLTEKWIRACDKQTARKFIKYHMCMGAYPRVVLSTSPLYNLRTTLKGHDIVVDNRTGSLTLDSVPIVSFDHSCRNGIIHHLLQPLPILN